MTNSGMFNVAYVFSASNKSCDEYLEQPFGYISSPDQDRDGFYDFNVFCEWTVRVAENYVIEFHVFYVDIQYSTGCTDMDFLKVYVSRIMIQPVFCILQKQRRSSAMR